MTPVGDVHLRRDEPGRHAAMPRLRPLLRWGALLRWQAPLQWVASSPRPPRRQPSPPLRRSRPAAVLAVVGIAFSLLAIPPADATEPPTPPEKVVTVTPATRPSTTASRPGDTTTITATPSSRPTLIPTPTRPRPPRPTTVSLRPTADRPAPLQPPRLRAPAGSGPAGVLGRSAPALSGAMTTSPINVTIAQVTPAIANPQAPLSITVNLHNSGADEARNVTVRVGVGDGLRNRAELHSYLKSVPEPGNPVTRVNLTSLAPGQRTAVTLPLPTTSIPMHRPYGVAAMSVQVNSSLPTRSHPWVLPYHQRADYRPTRLAFLAPIVTPPSPSLYADNSAASDQAWRDALKPGSHLDTLAIAARTLPITPVLDEGLAPPAAAPRPTAPSRSPSALTAPTSSTSAPPSTSARPTTSTASPLPTRTPAPSGSDAERTAFVSSLLSLHSPWVLPRRDPDLGALLAAHATTPLLTSLLDRTFPLPSAPAEIEDARRAEGETGAPRRVAWVEGRPLTLQQYSRLATDLGKQAPRVAIVPSSMLTALSLDDAVKAVKKTPEGLDVLAYDEPLSTTLTQTTTDNAVEQRQSLLADTALQVAEAPHADRTVAVSLGRDSSAPLAVLRDLISSTVAAPWISSTTPDDLLKDPARPAVTPRTGDDSSPTYAPSPLDKRAVHMTSALFSSVSGLNSVIRSSASKTSRLDDRISGLTATGWRGRPLAWKQASALVETLVAQESAKVRVLKSSVINFVAERSEIRFSVANDLGAEINGVVVKVDTDEKPSRLRILDQPLPVTVRSGASAMVRVPVEAVGAGVATLVVSLTSPEGIPIGQKQQIKVKVQPTKGWAVLGGGAILAVVFVAGLYRAIRRAPRVSEPTVAEQEELSSGALPIVTDKDVP